MLTGITLTAKHIAIGSLFTLAYGYIVYENGRYEREKKYIERTKQKYDLIKAKQKELEIEFFNEQEERRAKEISKQHEKIEVEKKAREVNDYSLVQETHSPIVFAPKMPPHKQSLMIGYDCKGDTVWLTQTNIVVTGTEGSGKTRFLYALIINALYHSQVRLYLGDLKGTDFKRFSTKRNVLYVSDLEHIPFLVKEFEKEYQRRIDLFANKGYIDFEDYNRRSSKKLRPYVLLIDEYADISATYHEKGRPMGVYADIIRLARKCRSTGGRIILATQRPDANTINGSLKNNCSILGLKMINTLNSNIAIGCDGCERLERGQGLMVIDGKLRKIFSYKITNQVLDEYVSKLK